MSGVEYIKENLSEHPQCIHGPTFLFSRETAKGSRRFFACSACRDRKDCSFFLWEDEKEKSNTQKSKATLQEKQQAYAANIDHERLYSVLKKVRKVAEGERRYCFTCNAFLDETDHETSHKIVVGVTDDQLNFPSTFLEPLENDKIEAQYLFSESAVKQIINILTDLDIRHVLCIGAPRIHEYIQIHSPNMKSLLLDIDKRYHNFFGPKQYCWYNMFNHYFFKPETKKHFLNFLKANNNPVLIMDPPFGGRLEPISQTVYAINEEHQKINSNSKNLSLLLFFPYFMEPHIKNHLPELQMADYKVNYDNHLLFAAGQKGRKFGSPVRIFTNIPLNRLKFDGTDYRYCDLCERYVYKENNHCYLCNACTSKDGRTYTHCQKCNRCVKPTWVHCKDCKKCAQPDHKCGEAETFSQSCFHCHEKGHKKSECPKINVEDIKRKRKVKNKTKNKKIKQ